MKAEDGINHMELVHKNNEMGDPLRPPTRATSSSPARIILLSIEIQVSTCSADGLACGSFKSLLR